MNMKLPVCSCGATTKLEGLVDLQAALFGKDPLKKTKWRCVCPKCGEGILRVFGFPTKEAAIKHFEDMKRIKLEVQGQ